MRIASLVFGRNQRCAAFSVIRRRASSGSSDVQKNGLRLLRSRADGLVRSQGAPGARAVMWRHADFSGIGGAAHRLSPLWQGEAGAARLPGR